MGSSKTFPESACLLDSSQLLQNVLVFPQLRLFLFVCFFEDVLPLSLEVLYAVVQLLRVLQQLLFGLRSDLWIFETDCIDLVNQVVFFDFGTIEQTSQLLPLLSLLLKLCLQKPRLVALSDFISEIFDYFIGFLQLQAE
jgi:hypothetical protein